MKSSVFKFSGSSTKVYFDGNFRNLRQLTDSRSTILITDENVYNAHTNKFKGWNTIIIKAGEEFKIQGTVDSIIEQLIAFEADRSSTLVGIGGGVVTDLTGYVASVYMRGIAFGFVPTTILGLVDASIGGKNGIDVGDYKNMVGVIRQPAFILHDLSLLQTLPVDQWQNGFAEIIKHSCIRDLSMFKTLENSTLDFYRKNKKALNALIGRNARLKIKLVQQDEFEKGQRRLLNFGHTLGHALETQYELLHGQAISLGMVAACRISEKLTGFTDTNRVIHLLENFGLPVKAEYNREKVIEILKMDKKRVKNIIHYILLVKAGQAVIKTIPIKQLEKLIQQLP